MKRFLCMVLAFVFVLLLIGCDGDSGEKNNTEDNALVIKQLEDQIEDLQEEIEKLEKENQKITKEKSELKKELDALKKEYESLINDNKEDDTTTTDQSELPPSPPEIDVSSDFKIGFIILHDELSTYDLNFINAASEIKEKLGLSDDQIIMKKHIPETNECYEAAADLVDAGCDIIFANSFGHEDFIIKASKEFTSVQFCHVSGTKAHTEGLANFHNAFASVYEGRYLTGIAAGMKLNEMIHNGEITADQAKIGYVGAFTYAEVVSAYTAFYLGAKSVCPSVTMEVKFSGSWYDEKEENKIAQELINNKCVLISQHADSMGAPAACENAGVPNVSYNSHNIESCPDTFIISSKINWTPYYEYAIGCIAEGEEIATDWCGGLAEGSIVLSQVNDQVAATGTTDAIEIAIEGLKNGTIKVFDIDSFTVDGEKIESYLADVDTDLSFVRDTEAIHDGFFDESAKRSAPYFDIEIDGITLLNRKY